MALAAQHDVTEPEPPARGIDALREWRVVPWRPLRRHDIVRMRTGFGGRVFARVEEIGEKIRLRFFDAEIDPTDIHPNDAAYLLDLMEPAG